MRIKVGPGEWLELGPGRAVTSNKSQASVAGLPVGKMVADHTSRDPLPKRVSKELRSPNPLGIRSR